MEVILFTFASHTHVDMDPIDNGFFDDIIVEMKTIMTVKILKNSKIMATEKKIMATENKIKRKSQKFKVKN